MSKGITGTLEEKILFGSEIDDNGCWLWLGQRTHDGYPLVWVGGKGGRYQRAHRVSYEIWTGAIPDGLTVDHLCFVRHCVNPDHLDACTRSENTRRARHKNGATLNRAKTHCPQGHRYGEDAYVYKGSRYCRACHLQYSKNYKERMKLNA